MAEVDVVVVGGGLAGLSTALGLHDAGRSVVVLEARDRVGGRTFSGELAGAEIDWGGQWIGNGQPRAYALVARLGLRTFPTYDTGDKLLELRGRVSRYSGTIPSMAPWKLVQLHAAIQILDARARKVDPAAPWAHPRAHELDATTLDAARRSFVWSADARATIDAAIRTIFGAESGDLSLLHALAYIQSASGLENLIATENGFQADRIAGGAQSISRGMAALLGDRVRLSTPVAAIDQRGDEVVVTTAGGDTISARRVVVAVPVPLRTRIAFAPRLPSLAEQLADRASMGAAVKCFVRYERPFWREAGLSGEVASGDGPLAVTFDQCGEHGDHACLLAFVGGRDARTWHTIPEAERQALVVDRFTRWFGDEASRPLAYAEYDWTAQPWSGGGPVALFPTGTLSTLGPALREPVGRLHWAGTETAASCMGFMEGALESGERATAEVLAALG